MKKLLTLVLAVLVLPVMFGSRTVSAQEVMRLRFAYIFSELLGRRALLLQ